MTAHLHHRKSAPPHSEPEAPSAPSPSDSAQPDESGLTLEEYGRGKGLPIGFLESLGVSQIPYGGKPALRIPYLGTDGEELAVRLRIALEGDRFRWEPGSKV